MAWWSKTIGILDWTTNEVSRFFFSRLEKDLWIWPYCYNCKYLWDIIWDTKNYIDSIVQCLWKQSWNEMKLWDTCSGHEYIDNYSELRIWD
jgi:hypothetical protein